MADFVERGMKALPLANIIMEAGHELALATPWLDVENIDSRAKCIHAAETLIEIAEVMTCGSTGGFGLVKVDGKVFNQQPKVWDSGSRWKEGEKYDRLFSRWLWLFTFYTDGYDKTNLGHQGWRTVGDLKKYYKKKD